MSREIGNVKIIIRFSIFVSKAIYSGKACGPNRFFYLFILMRSDNLIF